MDLDDVEVVTTRSMRAVAQVALGKMVGHSLKARFVVSRMLFFVAVIDDRQSRSALRLS